MKKLLTFFSIICLCFITVNSVNTKALSYKTLSISSTDNLLDFNNIKQVDNNTHITNINPIKVDGGESITFMIKEECMADRSEEIDDEIEIISYDGELEEIACQYVNFEVATFDVDIEGEGTVGYRCVSFELDEDAYAIDFYTGGCSDFLSYGETVMMIVKGEEPYIRFEQFSSLERFIELDTNTHPTIYATYANKLSSLDIKKMLVAEDEYKGVLTSEISVNCSTYTENYNKVGKYKVTATVSDGTNTRESYFYIEVKDVVAPTLTGPDTIEVAVNAGLEDDQIIAKYTAIDKYDGDISNRIAFSEAVDFDFETVNSKQVTLTVSDSSGNKTTKTITVKTIDTVGPVVNGETTVYIGYNAALTREQIIENYFEVSDNVDSELEYTYSNDTFTANYNKVGSWKFDVTIKDKSENETTKTITVVISDDIKPVIYLNLYEINATPGIALTSEDFDNLLYESGELSKGKKYTAVVINDTYTGNESKEGVYVYQIKYISDDEVLEKSFKINVNGTAYVVEENVVQDEENQALIIGLAAGSIVSLASILFMIFKKKKVKLVK